MFETAYQIPRTIDFADFNGDGYLDMFLAPGFSQHETYVPVEIWLNRGDGTFYNATAELFEGAPPLTWAACEVLIGDFNEDGRPDVFIAATGGEHAVADGNSNSGYPNTLVLSQPNGKYRDATANLPSNIPGFNHNAGVGDANGDGHLDIVVVTMPTTLVQSDGVKLFYGDGKGGFTDATAKLPEEIRFMPWTERPGNLVAPDFEYQMVGCAALADLDGDSKAEVITGTYNTPDRGPNGTRTVRIHKKGADGNFVERGRARIADAIAGIAFDEPPFPPGPIQGLGCPQIVAGDLDGDVRPDLVVTWEGNPKWYAQVLRNDGNLQFTDITVEALGGYDQGFQNGGGRMGPGHYRLRDINGDGKLDIVGLVGGINVNVLPQHLGWLNDGTGHFTPWMPQGPSGDLTSEQILSAALCANCGYLPQVFDTNKSGLASLVLLDFQSSVSAGHAGADDPRLPYRVHTDRQGSSERQQLSGLVVERARRNGIRLGHQLRAPGRHPVCHLVYLRRRRATVVVGGASGQQRPGRLLRQYLHHDGSAVQRDTV